ncbi:hypothetical protein WKK05_15565 [Nostoc sp. UHCC 0302]|uniref:hypothetical protein n=1 Tax=Nostoc sp. UHCC 0302 TaxID=3134896 RepID=UPI00311C979E
MSKLASVAMLATVLALSSIDNPTATLAGTCASQCGQAPIQFIPGQHIRLEVINITSNLVKLEKVKASELISLQPGQKLQFEQEDATQQNVSLVFWNERGLPLQAIVSKPNFGTLRVELRRGNRNPGDRSLYILNDGRVNIF